MPHERLVGSGRGLLAVKKADRGGSPDDFAEMEDQTILCHLCVNALVVTRKGMNLPIAYCKFTRERMLAVEACSDFKEMPSPSTSKEAPSVI